MSVSKKKSCIVTKSVHIHEYYLRQSSIFICNYKQNQKLPLAAKQLTRRNEN